MKTAKHWEKIGLRPHHGIQVPLFSLHTEKGPAQFLDLILLIDWCKKIGFDTIELLPLNDTGGDPSPYNLISSIDLNPRYGKSSELEQVKRHADGQGIFLKGDLPLLMSPESRDVKEHPEYFRFDFVAGAPPDKYNALGQKWGFPLYNWKAMEKDHFSWWKRRLATYSRFYHIYRIDHVVGLFRIWAIPPDKEATEGHFIPEDSSLWTAQGKKLLEMMIDASPLLPMAEDLGTIPPGVYSTLQELGICGIKVLRWQKEPIREKFSMTTVSTPDMEPLQADTYEERFAILKGAHHTPSYFHINLLQEYLSLFPELSWNDPEKERINVPGTVSPRNWTYRFKPTLEEIVSHGPLASAMKSLI